MPETPNPYDAVIADLEARRDQFETAIKLMKSLRDSGSTGGGLQVLGTGTVTEAPFVESDNIPTDAFFGLTIADGAVKYLENWANRKPQSTNTICEALERGGQKRSKYTTVYGILSRRAKMEGDVVNVKGDWGLKSWYGGTGGAIPRLKRKPINAPATDEQKESKPEPPVWKPNGDASGSLGA